MVCLSQSLSASKFNEPRAHWFKTNWPVSTQDSPVSASPELRLSAAHCHVLLLREVENPSSDSQLVHQAL